MVRRAFALRHFRSPLLAVSAALALTGCLPPVASAQTAPAAQTRSQTTVPDVPADTDYAPPIPAPAPIPATGFAMPDLPDGFRDYTTYNGRFVSTSFSLVPLVDYNAFVQDSGSETQVGEQANEWDLRTLRLMFRGQMKFSHPVDYLISVEVKGQDHVQTGDSSFGFTDFDFSTDVGRLGRLKVGKIKEPFSYEMVGDAANLQQQERALNPFFVSRGIGLRLTKAFAADAMTWSVGWFNDWWIEGEDFKGSGNDVAARFTGVPYFDDSGANYVHLGIGTRYAGPNDGMLRFRGRPESNVTAYYVDSGDIVADHANELDLELLSGRGPVFLSAEYARSWVDASASGDPSFWGGTVVVSYVLTGEHRPYDKKLAYARRILPQRPIGAFEVVGRFSHVDVADALIDGGVFDRSTAGLNWWATRRWKVGFDYGLIHLDRAGLKGVTHAFHTRFQWVY